MTISENGTKALVKTKKQPKGSWFIVPMLFPLVKPHTYKTMNCDIPSKFQSSNIYKIIKGKKHT